MILYFSPGSPYARMVRIALRMRGIPGVEEREATLRDPGSVLLPHNPVGRVPTLVLDDGTALTETLLILGHLDRIGTAPMLLPQDTKGLAELGRVMGLLDGIAVWNRELRRPPEERSPSVLALEQTRANRVADALAAAPPEDAAAALALACALGYCDRRHGAWRWREGRPRLAAWYDLIADGPHFLATMPPAASR